MALQFVNKPIIVNGKPVAGNTVTDSANGDLYVPITILAATGAVTQIGSKIQIDNLPIVSLTTHGNQTQVVRIPGSPKFETGSRNTPIHKVDDQGNTLQLNAKVSNGKLTDLSGTINFVNQNVVANVTFGFQNGGVQASGQIAITTGNLTVTLAETTNGAFSGSLTYKTADAQIALNVQAGSNQPAVLSLSVTAHF